MQKNASLKSVERATHTIDADGKILGRLASEISLLLQGKRKPEYVPNLDMGDAVIVKNASKIAVSGKKMEQKEYIRYTGYPGGLRRRPLSVVMQKNPAEVIFLAVYNMLPKNKLRKGRLKRLQIEP